MAVTQARLNRYRTEVDAYGDAAAAYVEQYIRELIGENPGATVEQIRDEAIAAIDDALSAFGDQASTLALDFLEEVAEAYGVSVETRLEDPIDPEMVDGGVRYAARRLVSGETEAFTRDVADLSRYYIHRSALENMERNCGRNDIRYARVPSGRETCGFCFMLSSRGFVYRSESKAGGDHGYHEHCDCVIVPGFKGLPASEQIEGYDPDEMWDRWICCQEAVGTDDEMRGLWDSMPKEQRSRYKGRNDAERYRRFSNALTIREVETRDFRWLNTGEIPRTTLEKGAKPLAKEREVAEALNSNGFAVEFIKEANRTHVKTADARLNGVVWEFKVPEAWNPDWTIRNQFFKAKGKGTSKLVISNAFEVVDDGTMLDSIRAILDSGDYPYIDEVLLVRSDGTLSRLERR